MRLLGEAIHLERIRGDLPGAEVIYARLFRDLPPQHPLRAEVCVRLLAVRLRHGDISGATAPLRELKDRHQRPALTARAEALIERALAPWSAEPGEGAVQRAPVLAVSEDGRTVAAWAGRGDHASPGQRLLVFRGDRAVARGILVRSDQGLLLVRLVGGTASVGCVLPIPGARSGGTGEPGRVDAGRVARARRLVAEWPGALREGEAAGAAPGLAAADGALRVWVLSCKPSAIATLPLRFARARERPDGSPGGPGLVAHLRPAAARELLGRVAAAVGPRGPISVLRRFERVVPPHGVASVELDVGTSRLPVGAAHSVFEGVRVSLRRSAKSDPARGAWTLRAETRDLPSEGVTFPGAEGQVTGGVFSTQALEVSLALRAGVPAAVVAGLDDPFAVGVLGAQRRQLLLVVMAPRGPASAPASAPASGDEAGGGR